MKMIKTLSATTNEQKYPFTNECLRQLAETAKDAPVLIDFDTDKKVGEVIYGEVTDEGLIITTSIDADSAGMYLVPGFLRGEKLKSMAYGLTKNPQDKTLPKINK